MYPPPPNHFYADHPPQYLPYPPPQFSPYPPPHHPNGQFAFPHPTPNLHFFPGPPGSLPLPPELTFGSSEDILRALQDLDLSKIASVLKTLNDAAAATGIGQSIPSIASASPPPTAGPSRPRNGKKKPVTASAILSRSEGAPSASGSSATGTLQNNGNRALDRSFLVPDQPENAGHAHLLATKWMNASKLADMVKKEGLVYKKGKFSAIEEEQLKAAIERYRMGHGLTPEQIQELIFSRNDKKDQAFWSDITASVPLRPITAVYHHVRRKHHPLREQGAWTPSEDERLSEVVAQLGQQWEKVATQVGRAASDCRDRYRNHLVHRDVRVSGQWSRDEEAELTQIVTSMTLHQGKDMDNDVFWGLVAQKMGNRRNRQQCRIKWLDALSKTFKNEGEKPRWSQTDAHVLVHKVDSLNVRDDTEIDWKLLPDESWNLWSAHVLQRRWMTLKKSVKGYEDMTHAEIMDILREKKAELPPPPASRQKRKTTSAETVADTEDLEPSMQAALETVLQATMQANQTQTQAVNDDGGSSEESTDDE
ncbi:hypothetical protein JAAARDRAFT_117611 [Jaapia argillacea MUCL 33604]|uniref:Uncharacterized protein n=1 Tax=Jaapia argillacea MUCL 33604 TaxID=933084 RepID=A0A067QL82_9AGAM|nr:hypothetical protein JAAARDRAFT_117611 [Jaapia argillacea MUCL 33604]